MNKPASTAALVDGFERFDDSLLELATGGLDMDKALAKVDFPDFLYSGAITFGGSHALSKWIATRGPKVLEEVGRVVEMMPK